MDQQGFPVLFIEGQPKCFKESCWVFSTGLFSVAMLLQQSTTEYIQRVELHCLTMHIYVGGLPGTHPVIVKKVKKVAPVFTLISGAKIPVFVMRLQNCNSI